MFELGINDLSDGFDRLKAWRWCYFGNPNGIDACSSDPVVAPEKVSLGHLYFGQPQPVVA